MRGSLHEVFAADAAGYGFALGLARRAGATKRLLWIVQDFSALEHGQVSATGLAEFGIDPAGILLMRAANATDALRAGADALGCSALGAVLVEIPGNPKILDLTASRRLVLGAQASGVTRHPAAQRSRHRAERGADPLAGAQRPLAPDRRVGTAALRRGIDAQPARRDRALDDGVVL